MKEPEKDQDEVPVRAEPKRQAEARRVIQE
jgi:hypothetical protein